MRPHAQDADDFFLFEDFVDEPVLDVDPARVFPGEVADEPFVRRRRLERIFLQRFDELRGYPLEVGCREFPGVFYGLLGIDNRPGHQSSSRALSSSGSSLAARMDSLIPGMEQR